MHKKINSDILDLKELVLMIIRARIPKEATLKELVDILKILNQIVVHKDEGQKQPSVMEDFTAKIKAEFNYDNLK